MPTTAEFRAAIAANAPLAGTFMKSPSVDVLEVLMLAGLDFVCLDCEHAPFDRATVNACMAVARAADFPILVRVPVGSPEQIARALDMGATALVVPHVTDAETAARIAKAARFGHGGRGYAGSTRWAGYGTRTMPEVLEASAETMVFAQIEDPEGVEAADAIAATDGINGLFLGPADLSVAYGKSDQSSAELMAAIDQTGAAARAHGKAYMTFVPNAARAAEWRPKGFGAFFIASEHAWMLEGARAAIKGIRALD